MQRIKESNKNSKQAEVILRSFKLSQWSGCEWLKPCGTADDPEVNLGIISASKDVRGPKTTTQHGDTGLDTVTNPGDAAVLDGQ